MLADTKFGMRAGSIVLLLLLLTQAQAGFSVRGWCSALPCASLHSHPTLRTTLEELYIPEIVESVMFDIRDCEEAGEDGEFTVCSWPNRDQGPDGEADPGSLVQIYLITSEAISNIRPNDIHLDLCFDFNGVAMGGLASIEGLPIGNGRRGIVRIDGLDGTPLPASLQKQPIVSQVHDFSTSRDDPMSDMTKKQSS